MRIQIRAAFVVLAIVTALVLPGVASAQDPAVDTYGGTGGEVQNEVDQGGALPFTGSDTLLLGVGGLVLVGVGAGLAYASARMRNSDARA